MTFAFVIIVKLKWVQFSMSQVHEIKRESVYVWNWDELNGDFEKNGSGAIYFPKGGGEGYNLRYQFE